MPECTSVAAAPRLSVSVIVPVHQDGELFRRCLSSLARATPSPNEVILVADGAGDSIGRLAKEFGFKSFKNLTGSGPARTRNAGALHARGDLLFFVDSDVTLPPDTIAKVQTAFAQDPQPAAVIGSYDDKPAARNFLSQYKNLFHHYVHQNSNEEASTFWGACGAIRRDIFLELGGFDEQYPRPCIEDIEFGIRIKKAGHRIRLFKMLQCKHLKKWGIRSLLKSDLFDRALPWTELILRDHALINDLNLRLSSRLSVALLFASMSLLIAGFWRLELAAIALALFAALLAINHRVYRFFFNKRGLWFMIKAIPWHCIYYLCCGLAVAVVLARALFKRVLAFSGRILTGNWIVWRRKSV
jgi:GT2 family glycosyltransferase